MSVIRAFIAIDLTLEVRQRLDKVASQLKDHLDGIPIRWVPADNMHLTLKFLGDISESNVEMLKKIINTEVADHRPFEMSVGGLGAFPNIRRPRVIWIGVEAPPELATIQHGIESALARLGYPPEDRPFSAHLTLGRVSRGVSSQDTHHISELLESTKIGFLGLTKVNQVCLYRSDLKPAGAVYTRVYAAPLNSGQE